MIDDAMADIAAVFHWPVSEMAEMTVSEVLDWRDRAVERWKQMHASDKTKGR